MIYVLLLPQLAPDLCCGRRSLFVLPLLCSDSGRRSAAPFFFRRTRGALWRETGPSPRDDPTVHRTRTFHRTSVSHSALRLSARPSLYLSAGQPPHCARILAHQTRRPARGNITAMKQPPGVCGLPPPLPRHGCSSRQAACLSFREATDRRIPGLCTKC